MQKVKSIYLAMVAVFTIFTSSVEAESFLKLSPRLQALYNSWNDTSGSIVWPYVEYTYEGLPWQAAFYSDRHGFDTTVQVPSDLSEFAIYLPTMMFGKYIKFTFKAEACNLHSPDFRHGDKETKSLLYDGLCHIDMENIHGNKGKCLLTPENQAVGNALVSISDLP